MKIKLLTVLVGACLMLTAESFAGQIVKIETCYETRGNVKYVVSFGNTCEPGSYTCKPNSCSADKELAGV